MRATSAREGAVLLPVAGNLNPCTFATWNKVYRGMFKEGQYPARAFIGSGKLLFDARFEVQGIAVKAGMAQKKK